MDAKLKNLKIVPAYFDNEGEIDRNEYATLTLEVPMDSVTAKMDAKLKNLKIVPAHFDNEGEIDRNEYATLTLEVPMDSVTAKEKIVALFSMLATEFVVVEIEAHQKTLPKMTT